MKYLLTLFLAVNAFAGWQQDCPQSAKGDDRRMLAWLGEAVAYATNSVTTTNVTVKPVELLQAEQVHEGLLNKVGGSCTNTYEVNMAICRAFALKAVAENNAVGIALVPLISDSYAQLKAAGSNFDPWAGSYTNIVTETTYAPTRHRWQDYPTQFKAAPTKLTDLKGGE
jgi:hypothetical protein